jgi:hypothetical protein
MHTHCNIIILPCKRYTKIYVYARNTIVVGQQPKSFKHDCVPMKNPCSIPYIRLLKANRCFACVYVQNKCTHDSRTDRSTAETTAVILLSNEFTRYCLCVCLWLRWGFGSNGFSVNRVLKNRYCSRLIRAGSVQFFFTFRLSRKYFISFDMSILIVNGWGTNHSLQHVD